MGSAFSTCSDVAGVAFSDSALRRVMITWPRSATAVATFCEEPFHITLQLLYFFLEACSVDLSACLQACSSSLMSLDVTGPVSLSGGDAVTKGWVGIADGSGRTLMLLLHT